eukprot:1144857-Pelagomonas_calceolata.AAC.2
MTCSDETHPCTLACIGPSLLCAQMQSPGIRPGKDVCAHACMCMLYHGALLGQLHSLSPQELVMAIGALTKWGTQVRNW